MPSENRTRGGETSRRSAELSFDEADALRRRWFELSHETGRWGAWRQFGPDLRRARAAFGRIAADGHSQPRRRAIASMYEGVLYSEVGRLFDAVESQDRAVRISPDNALARGARGMDLADLMPNFHGAHAALRRVALEDLEYAMAHPNQVSEQAMAKFRYWRDRMLRSQGRPEPETAVKYRDRYAEWAYREGLLLTPVRGFRPPLSDLDPLLIGSLVVNIDAEDAWRVPEPFRAMNAFKRDYLSARLLAWVALAAPDEIKLRTRSARAHFIDTLDYASWDLGTGIAAIAASAATNLTDKLATFLVLWLRLPQSARAADERNWSLRPGKGGRRAADVEALLDVHGSKVEAILGLLDLTDELRELSDRRDEEKRVIRDAETHRFLSVHVEGSGNSTEFVAATSYTDLSSLLLRTLAGARRMFLQVVLAVSQHEATKRKGVVPSLPLTPFDSRFAPLARQPPSRGRPPRKPAGS